IGIVGKYFAQRLVDFNGTRIVVNRFAIARFNAKVRFARKLGRKVQSEFGGFAGLFVVPKLTPGSGASSLNLGAGGIGSSGLFQQVSRGDAIEGAEFVEAFRIELRGGGGTRLGGTRLARLFGSNGGSAKRFAQALTGPRDHVQQLILATGLANVRERLAG